MQCWWQIDVFQRVLSRWPEGNIIGKRGRPSNQVKSTLSHRVIRFNILESSFFVVELKALSSFYKKNMKHFLSQDSVSKSYTDSINNFLDFYS